MINPMKIKSYGSRGSIPVSGKQYLKYGGDTTCITITSKDGDLVIIDAGTGIRRVGNDLVSSGGPHNVSILFTHAHWDHLIGFPYFKPLFNSKFEISLYGCPFIDNNSVKDMIAGTMKDPYSPIDLHAFSAKINYNNVKYSSFNVGSLSITPIHLSHPNQGIGYKIVEGEKSFVFLTDNELGHRHHGGLEIKDYIRDCKNVDLLFHDGESTDNDFPLKRTWGHSSYKEATDLALKANVKSLGIVHHNQDRSDEQVDEIIADCNRIIKENNGSFECFGVTAYTEIDL
jgi:phosphoribosyl 1,2-cyclic phosphodiesterase